MYDSDRNFWIGCAGVILVIGAILLFTYFSTKACMNDTGFSFLTCWNLMTMGR